MSYQGAIAGVLERLRTVAGLAAVLHGEPTAVHEPPIAYCLFDGFRRNYPGQLVEVRYQIMIRVVVAWQDNAAAEDELAVFVNSIPAAFSAGPLDVEQRRTLGGRVNAASITGARSGEGSGFHTIGGALYRTATFDLDVLEKQPGDSGI